MISEKVRQIFSERPPKDGEQTVIFLEDENRSFVYRLFRAGDHAGDPERRAIQWLGRAKGLCQSALGELNTGLIRSKDEMNVMAIVSGSEIEAREWPRKIDDSPVDRRTPLHAGCVAPGTMSKSEQQ